MGNTNADGIWTPDEDDTHEPDVWSQMMGDSISQGLGKRMKLQETRVSLRATTPEPFMVVSTAPGDAYTPVPLTVGGVTGSRAPDPDFAGGNHANGVDIVGNHAVIVTAGFYTISGQISVLAYDGYAPHSFDFFGTINGTVFGLPGYGATNNLSYVGSIVSDTRYLAKGDTVGLTIGVGTDHIGGFRVQDALLAISMQYATPEV